MKRICKIIADYMGLLVLLSAGAALVFPGALGHLKPSLINPMLGVIMFGMGLTLKGEDFRVVFSRPRDVIIGCVAQFTVMPLLAFALSKLFALDEALMVGVILVGCCPGGTASNVITYLAKGDLALSVGMTAVSTLLAPLLTPLLVLLFAGRAVDVNVVGMLLSILWVVILPIALGLLVRHLWPAVSQHASDYLPAISSLAICVIVMIVIAANAGRLLSGGAVVVAVVVLHNVCGLGLGYLTGWMLGLDKAKRRAISIEVGMQNSGLATSLAASHFASMPMAAVPGAIFSVWHNISGAVLARFYARK
ncbi:MAG: bile acid:sodium symporter family protein [Bacteroidales bacterium]|nr:bile acid:sodium symporter family protein [Bacteroidales bacterium]